MATTTKTPTVAPTAGDQRQAWLVAARMHATNAARIDRNAECKDTRRQQRADRKARIATKGVTNDSQG